MISEKVGKWENGIRDGFSGKMKMGANNTILNLIIFYYYFAHPPCLRPTRFPLSHFPCFYDWQSDRFSVFAMFRSLDV